MQNPRSGKMTTRMGNSPGGLGLGVGGGQQKGPRALSKVTKMVHGSAVVMVPQGYVVTKIH